MTLLTKNAMWKWCSVAEEGGVCDPVIDEHFRRSLGKDYLALFSDSGHQKPAVSKPDNTNSSEHSASSLSGTSTTLRHRVLSNIEWALGTKMAARAVLLAIVLSVKPEAHLAQYK